MKKLITVIPFLLGTLLISPEANAHHLQNALGHKWWTDTRPNVILVNWSNVPRTVECGGKNDAHEIGPGNAVGCTDPANVGLYGADLTGIAVYYCTAQFDCQCAANTSCG